MPSDSCDDDIAAGRFRTAAWFWAALAILGVASVAWAIPDARSWKLIQNTLRLVVATSAISVSTGTLLAWLLVRTDLPGRKVFGAVLGAMLFVPLYLQAAAWQAGFGLQGWQSLIFQTPPLLDGWTGAVWIHAVASLPWVVLIVGVGFWMVEPELEQQALLDGSVIQVLTRVTLPAAAGSIVVAAVWVAMVAAGEMTVTDLFQVRTYAEEIYTRATIGPQPGDPPLGMVSGGLLCAWLVLAGLMLASKVAPRDRPPSLRRPHVFALGKWRIPAGLLVAAVLLLVAGVPLGSLVHKAGVVVTQTDDGRIRDWSAVKCATIVATSPHRYGREFNWSWWIAASAATAAASTAIVLAWLARNGRFSAALVLLLIAILLAVPGPVVGLVVIHLLNRPEIPLLTWLYDQSILAPWLALSLRGLAPAVLILWHAFRFVPTEVLDAAAVDGASPMSTLCRIVLPSKLPAIAIAWLVVLAVALGDLAASILVVPPGVTTLSIRIFGLLHYGVEDQVAGIALALVGLFVGLMAAIAGLAWWWSADKSRSIKTRTSGNRS